MGNVQKRSTVYIFYCKIEKKRKNKFKNLIENAAILAFNVNLENQFIYKYYN